MNVFLEPVWCACNLRALLLTSLNYTKPLFCIIRNRLMWSVLERFPIKKTAVKTAVSAYLGSLAKIF